MNVKDQIATLFADVLLEVLFSLRIYQSESCLFGVITWLWDVMSDNENEGPFPPFTALSNIL